MRVPPRKKKRKEKITPFGVNLMTSQAVSWEWGCPWSATNNYSYAHVAGLLADVSLEQINAMHCSDATHHLHRKISQKLKMPSH